MKSNGSTNFSGRSSNQAFRQVVVLTAVAIILIGLLVSWHSKHPATPATDEQKSTVAISNDSSRPPEKFRLPKSSQPSQESAMEGDTAKLISYMLDKSMALQVRRQAARTLGKVGTPEAITALKTALTNDTPPYVKAAIAEGLGQNPSPEARDLLHELVSNKDETVARGAARGLAARGDADAADALGHLLFNDKTPMSVRTEAALALGDVELPAAQDLLTRAISQIHDEDVIESVLDGLGRRPFSDTEAFFRNYLNSPDVPTESKILAIEAVRDADGDHVVPFLSRYLNDSNPEVRAAAKEALDFLK